MAVLILTTLDLSDTWLFNLVQALNTQAPTLELYIWPECEHPDDIEVALVWNGSAGILQRFSNLKLIISLGVGTDHILADSNLPAHVPIVRSVYDQLPMEMVEYVTLALLSFKRRISSYQALQRSHQWQQLPTFHQEPFIVGILGLGALGSPVAQTLVNLGLTVRGWSRNPKTIAGVDCFYGNDQFKLFLNQCRAIVCLLPLTPETQGILSGETFAALPQGAYLVNVGRGQHLVEEDLLSALESGQISGAYLDVFKTEPLPSNHPFWSHPSITITPHIACISQPERLAEHILETIRRAQSGQPLAHLVDQNQGY